MGGHLLNSSASGPMPTSRYCDHMPLATSTSFTRAASGEPGLMPRRSGPTIAWISRRAPSASAGLPFARSSITRSSRLATKVTPLALTACRSRGREQPRPRGVARALDAVGREGLERAQRRRRLDRGADLGRGGGVEQLARGGIRPGEVDHLVAAHRDDRRPVLRRHPGAPDQQGVGGVARQAVAGREPRGRAHRSAAYTASTRLATRRSGCRAVPVTYWLVT